MVGIIHHGWCPPDHVSVQLCICQIYRAARLLHDQQTRPGQVKCHGFQRQAATGLYHDQTLLQKCSPDDRAGLGRVSLGHGADDQAAAGIDHDLTCDLHRQFAGVVSFREGIPSKRRRYGFKGKERTAADGLGIQTDPVDVVFRFGELRFIASRFFCAGFFIRAIRFFHILFAIFIFRFLRRHTFQYQRIRQEFSLLGQNGGIRDPSEKQRQSTYPDNKSFFRPHSFLTFLA